MRRQTWMAVGLIALVAAVPVWAGHSGEKCTESTQVCLDKMTAKLKSSGFVGVELDKDKTSNMYVVKNVIPGTPAETAGIQKDDVLYALNGVVISESNEAALQKVRAEWKPGQQVTYTIRRNGADRDVSLTLAPMPADVMARWIGEHMMEHASVEVSKNEPSKN